MFRVAPVLTLTKPGFMWANSDTPEEYWSDVDGVAEDGEWPIKGIVGEELDLSFVPR
jgi:[histone H3]-lysine9 N-trimethyltransferase SUV39H